MYKYIILGCLCLIMFYPAYCVANGSHHVFNASYVVYSLNTRIISVGLSLIDIKQYHNTPINNDIYSEVLSYSKQKPFGDEHGRTTNVHETVHGINNELRNYYKQNLKQNVNVFYAGGGKAILVHNPKLTIRDIIPYIPAILKGYRYNLYFVKQLGDWNDVPTYHMDEWSAYIAGAECGVSDAGLRLNTERSDCVSGALEFSIYCTALALAVKNKDPEYWSNNEQFKNAIQYFLIKSERVFFEGKDLFPSKEQDKLLEHLRNHPDAQELRDFLFEEFQGIFVD